MFSYEGRTAVITGAGSGFGREFARIAAARGMNLVLADIQQDALDETRAEMEKAGAPVITQRVDVAKVEQVDALAKATFERFGTPHLLFNNAGVGSGGLIWESALEDWEWVMGVNLWGVIYGIRAFVPAMVAAGQKDENYRGHVVNTASMAGLLNPPNMGVYNVSKEAVISVSETLYQDLDLIGARVGASVLCPYFVPTGISDAERNRTTPKQPLTRSQEVGRENGRKAVSSGKLTAADIGRMTYEAIDENRFYIYSHPHALGNLEARMEGMLRTGRPPDPFAERPHVREALRERMLAPESAA
ncbi:SDR family oxidoreductase [Verticiella sediminum]|uniref:SDR family oxidoreductase n=1 Tax=Verticiella sediminum TaxID=1247510 RepID=A0A556AM07_9BURK|nr:SDR family oxidoreductase [Verticiella sediminum]TSH93901.1 SDR family oxidoreductase [Verticiella sediminum]